MFLPPSSLSIQLFTMNIKSSWRGHPTSLDRRSHQASPASSSPWIYGKSQDPEARPTSGDISSFAGGTSWPPTTHLLLPKVDEVLQVQVIPVMHDGTVDDLADLPACLWGRTRHHGMGGTSARLSPNGTGWGSLSPPPTPLWYLIGEDKAQHASGQLQEEDDGQADGELWRGV